ncbi:MAG TPA: hypothetical protein DCP91_11160 [Eggerthellaceae bacterium]|nr:hypothetical protein [Eggerthellaceae bacterium]
MDAYTAHMLNGLTASFYAEHASSFSATRDHPWPGWERAWTNALRACGTVCSVLDVAGGNLRFRAFCRERGLASAARYHAVDSCRALLPGSEEPVPQGEPVQLGQQGEPGLSNASSGSGEPCQPNEQTAFAFHEADVTSALLQGRDPLRDLAIAPCDLVACFGFAHHVPGARARTALLESLLGACRPGGAVVVSFWQFDCDDRFARKAQRETQAALAALECNLHLDEGDYLLGWKNQPGAHRYCHSFSDEELDALADHVAGRAVLLDRYRADGRTGTMNSYLAFSPRV